MQQKSQGIVMAGAFGAGQIVDHQSNVAMCHIVSTCEHSGPCSMVAVFIVFAIHPQANGSSCAASSARLLRKLCVSARDLMHDYSGFRNPLAPAPSALCRWKVCAAAHHPQLSRP